MNGKALFSTLLAAGILVAIAQEGATGASTITVAESQEHGAYLTDGEGRAVYLFLNETGWDEEAPLEPMTEGIRDNAASCTDDCLRAWPPVTGEPTAGEGVDDTLLYTAEVEGNMQVVYNGWPLYYFAADQEPGSVIGHGRGPAPNVKYLVSPDGSPIRGEAATGM